MVRQTSELPAQRRCEVLLLDTNGYPAGQDTKIPVGRIVCDSTFDSYMSTWCQWRRLDLSFPQPEVIRGCRE